jgi:hypothetical protein
VIVGSGGPLLEAGSASFDLHRDACGQPLEVQLFIDGEAGAADFSLGGGPPDQAPIRFGEADAGVTIALTGVEDGVVEHVEALELSFFPRGDSAGSSTAASLELRLVDGDQDGALLASFDGRAVGELLAEAGEEPVRAELLPTAASGPGVIEGGPAGPYLSFDGDDDLVIIDDVRFPGEFTVAFAFRTSAELGPGFRYLYGHGNINRSNHLNVYLTSDGTLRTSLRGSGDASDFGALDVSDDFRDEAWHHVAVVVDPAVPSVAVYVDGVEAATGARGGPTFNPPHPIFLASRWDVNPTRGFRGDLDEVLLLGRAMTAQEVADLAAPFLVR